MSPQSQRGILRVALALGLVLLMLAPPASLAQGPQDPPVDPAQPQDTTPPNTGPPPPDLIPSDTHYSGTDERAPTKLCNTASNVGYDPTVTRDPVTGNYVGQPAALPTGSFNVRIRVERNLTVNGTITWRLLDDEQTRIQAGPGGGQGVETCWNFTLEAGHYRAIVDVDSANEVAEANARTNATYNPAEDNNKRITAFPVDPTPRPDLKVSQISVQPRNARPGDTQLFSATIVNTGRTNSSLTWVDLVDATGRIARLRLAPLQPLQSLRVVTLTHPDERAPGEFVVHAVADPLDDVTETNETNNEASTTYGIAPHPQADLTLKNVTLSGTLMERRGIRIEGELLNIGNATSKNSTVRLYLDDAPARNITLPNDLPSNASSRFQFFFILTPGTHSLHVQADPTDVVPELDESNNDWQQIVTVEPATADQSLPNLIVDRLDAGPLDPSPNEVVNVTGLVHNIGTKRSENTSVSFYIGSKKLGSAHVGPVNPEVSVSFRYAWAAPPPGPYELRAWVDPDGLVNETDTNDNNYTIDFDVEEARAQDSPPTNDTGSDAIGNGTGNATIPPPPGAGPITIEPSSTNGMTGIEIPQLQITTRAIPGGVKGIIQASLRNPSIEPISKMTVTFSIDGVNVKTQLFSNLGGAATAPVTSGEIDVPGGSHTVSVEAKVLGTDFPPTNVTRAYQATPGDKSIVPGPAAMSVLVAATVIALAVGRRKK